MPEDEFELYLTLLAKTLRLKDAQRRSIANELRDHLEARLNELTDQGVDRRDAIRYALEEFGDASALAGDLQRVTTQTKRRHLMRTSIGALAAACLIALAFTYVLPSDRAGVPENPSALAQQEPQDGPPETPEDDQIRVFDITALAEHSTRTRYDFEKLTRLELEIETAKLEIQYEQRLSQTKAVLVREGRVPSHEYAEVEMRMKVLELKIIKLEGLLEHGKEMVTTSDFTKTVEAIRTIALSDTDPRHYGLAELNGQLVVRGDAQVHAAVEAVIQALHNHNRPH